jgi:hypothetical protein
LRYDLIAVLYNGEQGQGSRSTQFDTLPTGNGHVRPGLGDTLVDPRDATP